MVVKKQQTINNNSNQTCYYLLSEQDYYTTEKIGCIALCKPSSKKFKNLNDISIYLDKIIKESCYKYFLDTCRIYTEGNAHLTAKKDSALPNKLINITFVNLKDPINFYNSPND